MKKIKFSAIFLALVLLMSLAAVPYASAQDAFEPASNSFILMDMKSGTTIFEKEASSQAAPSSLTKMMTALLAIEAVERSEISMGDEVTASANLRFDLSEESAKNLSEGETMSLENLLYCVLLGSYNDACNVVAEYVGGTVNDFVAKMNERAAELGCTGTNFVNTHGEAEEGHYSTAKDMALIAREAVAHGDFMKICNTVSITVPSTNVSGIRNLTNSNGLINKNSALYPGYEYESAEGIMAGYSPSAGYCLVSTAAKEDVHLICVAMGGLSRPNTNGVEYTNFADTVAGYDWAFKNFSYREVLSTSDLIEDVPVAMGANGNYVTVHPQNSIVSFLANEDNLEGFEQEIVIFSEEKGEELVAPIDAGEILGEITVTKNGEVYGSTALVADTSVDLSYMHYLKNRMVKTVLKPTVLIVLGIILVLIAVYIFIVLRYNSKKRAYITEIEKRRQEAARVRAERAEEKEDADVKANTQSQNCFDNDTEEEGESKEEALVGAASDSANEKDKEERDYFEEFFGKK